jgi:hypothetical protein
MTTENEPGKPADPGGETPPETPNFVTKEDFDKVVEQNQALAQKLDQALLNFESFGQQQRNQQQYQPPPQPAVDPNATKIATLEQRIADMDEAVDKAVYEGKGVGKLLRERDKLVGQLNTIQTEQAISQRVGKLEEFGMNSIGQLSKEIVSTKMPRLNVPEVKRAYDDKVSQLPPEMKANPEALMQVYRLAVGENLETILGSEQESWLRSQAETATQNPGASGGARGGANGSGSNIPKPEDILDKENLKAIRALGKNVDSYYQSMGYKGGWADFWEQTGKHDSELNPEEGE